MNRRPRAGASVALGAISGGGGGGGAARRTMRFPASYQRLLFNVIYPTYLVCVVFPLLIYLVAYVDVKCRSLGELPGSHSMFSDAMARCRARWMAQ